MFIQKKLIIFSPLSKSEHLKLYRQDKFYDYLCDYGTLIIEKKY